MDSKDVVVIKAQLKSKFEEAKKRELNEKIHHERQTMPLNENTAMNQPIGTKQKKKVTVKDAEMIKRNKNELKNKFRHEFMDEINNIDSQRKIYKPITDALNKVESAVKKVDEDILKQKPIAHDTSLPALPAPEIVEKRDRAMTFPTDSETQTENAIHIGSLAKRYIVRLNDPVFGISYNHDTEVHKIGKMVVTFEDDDIIINDKKYEGTQGLWRLLTYNEAPPPQLYTEHDFQTYAKILNETDAMYQNNDSSKNKPKSSRGSKWNYLISPIWAQKTGGGLLKYDETPIEYKYIHNLNELLQRLYYIHSQESAGNNNFHNEKLGIIHFFTNELENVIDTPKGIEYLIRFASALPKNVVNKGAGMFNTYLNNLQTELHVPGFNYLGPGTKLEKRLIRGDKPTSNLDKLAMDHDIYYSKHKSAKERHVADKILEEKAWEIVKDPNESLKQRSVAYLTTNAMKIKRHLGLGLKF